MKRLLTPLLIFAIAVFVSTITPNSNAAAHRSSDYSAITAPAPDISSQAVAVESKAPIIYESVASQTCLQSVSKNTPESEVAAAGQELRRAIKNVDSTVVERITKNLRHFRT